MLHLRRSDVFYGKPNTSAVSDVHEPRIGIHKCRLLTFANFMAKEFCYIVDHGTNGSCAAVMTFRSFSYISRLSFC